MRIVPRPGEIDRHTAGVYRREAMARRQSQPAFAAVLDTWAANADRRAEEAEGLSPAQLDLFGEAA